MLKLFQCCFLLILIHPKIWCQSDNVILVRYIPPKVSEIDSAYYNLQIQYLKEEYNKIEFNNNRSENKNDDSYHNINIIYAKLHAPKDKIESMFKYLINQFGIHYCDMVLANNDWAKGVKKRFTVLYNDEWNMLCNDCSKIYSSLDSNLIKLIQIIDYRDKFYRDMPNNSNRDMAKQTKLDSINGVAIDSLISIYGYVGISLVGSRYKNVCWSVIQHNPIKFQKKHFNMLKKASQNDEMSKSNIAYSEDRIMVHDCKKQKYGTQYYFDELTNKNEIYQLIDPKQVDNLRLNMGLISLSSYMKSINGN